jgi:eukaryotic-like serine/threonine-protein kinase
MVISAIGWQAPQLSWSGQRIRSPLKSCPECYSEYDDSLEKCPSDDTALRTIEKDPLIGTRLADRYEIVEVVGRGGMGVVYKVRQEYMDRFMAIKMLHSHMVADSEAVKRFFREAKTVSQVRHHHIITLYDFGMSKLGQPYLVMDYLEGTSLKNELKDHGPISIEQAASIYTQVCDALASAHAVNLVHRDLKPENIMLSKNGGQDDWVTLVDFGLSKLRDPKKEEENLHITKVGDVCGSPPYMSPEQCLSSLIVDPRSDIYSLAICVYETLSAKLPFAAKSAIEMLDCHLYATPIPFNQSIPELKVCSELTHVLSKALQKDPEKRHQTIEEFGQELRDACRRDALKFRTAKHRVEISSYSDLMSEAEALRQQALSDSRLSKKTPPEGVQFVNSTTSTLVESAKGAGESKNPAWLAKIKGAVATRKRNGAKEAAEEDLPLDPGEFDTCPYCASPIQPGIKFCISCQHQLVSPQDLAKLRTAKGGYNMGPKNGRAPTESIAFSKRSKNSLNNSGLSTAQQIIIVLLVFGCIALYIASNHDLQSSLRRAVASINPSASSEPPHPTAATQPAHHSHYRSR